MSTESFITTNVIDDDILVINLRGKLDSATTKEFEDAIRRCANLACS